MSETATTPGYGAIPAAGYSQERRPMRPPMVIIRTGSYGYGSFGRLPSEGLRQRTRRTKSHMKEQEPLLESNPDDEEDEEAATGHPPRASGSVSSVDGTLPDTDLKDDEDVEDDEPEETKSTGYLILLTLGIGGYVVCASADSQHVTNHLGTVYKSLGLPNSQAHRYDVSSAR